MSLDPDTTRIVRSWLDEGVTQLPDRVLDLVLDELPATPQRRATPWPTRRLPIMSKIVPLGLAAAAVAIATLLGIHYLGSTNVGGPLPSDPAPTPELPRLEMPGTRASPAGEYGWEGVTGTEAGMHYVPARADAGTAMTFAVREDCYAGAAAAEGPTTVTVGGYDATVVQPHEPGIGYPTRGSEITRAYAVDVDGTTLCIFVSWYPATLQSDIDAAIQVVESIRAQERGEGRVRITFTLPAGWDVG
jgi:hypothetical protein